jgi:hypothetical protein
MDLHYDEIDKSYRTEASNPIQNVPFRKAAVFYMHHTNIIHFFQNKTRNVLEIQFSVSKRVLYAYCMYITQFLLKLLQ